MKMQIVKYTTASMI